MEMKNLFGKVVGGVAAVAMMAVFSLTILPNMHDGSLGFGATNANASSYEHFNGDHNNGGHNGEHSQRKTNHNDHTEAEHTNGHDGKGHTPNDHGQGIEKK